MLLLSGLAILLVHNTFFHSGYFGFDELTYSTLAHDLFEGNLDKKLNLFSYRLGIILPLALSYFLFGINDFSNMIPSLLALLVTLFILLKYLRPFPMVIKIICALYFICFPIHLMYLAKPMPDIIVELGFLLCFSAYFLSSYSLKTKNDQLWVLFLIGGILIFLSKETFLIIYPFFLLLLISDLRAKKKHQFWKKSLLAVFIFLIGYFIYFYLSTGNPIIRVDAIFHERYISECSYEFQPLSILLKRVSYELWVDFMQWGVLIPVGFLMLLSKKYDLSKGERFILKSYLAMLLISNFMTISYTDYVPLCNDVRHFLFVFPLGVLGLGIGLKYLPKMNPATILIIGSTIIIQGLLCEYLLPETYWTIFLPLGAGVILWGFTKTRHLAVFLIITGIIMQFYHNAEYNLRTNHPAQKELIYFVISKPGKMNVITDSANTRLAKMYSQYANENISFFRYHDFDGDINFGDTPTYVILNGMTAWFSKVDWSEVPDEFKEESDALQLLFSNEIGKVFKWHSNRNEN